MSKIRRFFILLGMVCCAASAVAQETASEEMEAVPRVLASAKYVNKAKPNLKARIYFVYQSRSACGICVREAPTLVKEYKKMKRKGCEMVMLNIDTSEEAAARWVKNAKMTFPVISPAVSMSCGMPWDYTGRPLLPCMVAMTPDGTKLGEASGSEVGEFVKDWKKLLRELDKQNARAAAAAVREKARAEKLKGRNKPGEDEEDEVEDDQPAHAFRPIRSH